MSEDLKSPEAEDTDQPSEDGKKIDYKAHFKEKIREALERAVVDDKPERGYDCVGLRGPQPFPEPTCHTRWSLGRAIDKQEQKKK